MEYLDLMVNICRLMYLSRCKSQSYPLQVTCNGKSRESSLSRRSAQPSTTDVNTPRPELQSSRSLQSFKFECYALKVSVDSRPSKWQVEEPLQHCGMKIPVGLVKQQVAWRDADNLSVHSSNLIRLGFCRVIISFVLDL